MIRGSIAALAFALSIAVPACVSYAPSAAAEDNQASSKAFADANKKMMDAMMKTDAMMNMNPSGDADKDFALMMIPHHQGAIDMAEVELKYGKDPELRKMAKKIVEAQKTEIEEFQRWQQKHPM